MNEHPPAADAPDRLLLTGDVLARVPTSKESLFRWIKAGKFPRPEKLAGGRLNTWRESVVEAWIRSGGAS